MVQRAPISTGKVGTVVENTRLADDSGFPFAVFFNHPALFGAGLVVLPQGFIELCHPTFGALAILFVGEMCAKGTAASIGRVFVHTWAAASKDAGPAGSEPGEIQADALGFICGVSEFKPLTWKLQEDLRHALTLGVQGERQLNESTVC